MLTSFKSRTAAVVAFIAARAASASPTGAARQSIAGSIAAAVTGVRDAASAAPGGKKRFSATLKKNPRLQAAGFVLLNRFARLGA